MKKFNLSLKKKALLGIVILLLPVIITFLLSYHRNKSHLEKQVLNDLTVIAEAYEGQVYQFLDMLRQRAGDFATDGIIIRHLLRKSHKDNAAADALCRHLVNNKLPLSKQVKTINVLSPEGRVVASTNSAEIGSDFSGVPFFIKGRETTAITEIDAGHGGSPELAISTPIFSKNRGRILGVLVNYIHISELSKTISGEYYREIGAVSWDMIKWKWNTMEVYLVNKDRFMITNSIFVKDAILKQMVDTLPVETYLTSNKEMAGFYKDYRGVEVAGVSMNIYLPSLQWILLVEVDADEVLVVAKDMVGTVLITAVIVIGLIVLLFTFFMKRVVKPLRKISSTARSVAAGNFSIVTTVKTGDEIGTLYESFNYMVSQINARTHELEKSNARLANAQKIARLGNWEWDIWTNALLWSDEIYRIFGVDSDTFVPTFEKFQNAIHPDDKEFVHESIRRAVSEKTPYNIEYRIVRPDGSERVLHSQGEVLYDDAGNAVRMGGTALDITDFRRAEKLLREFEEKYRSLIESVPYGIQENDLSGTITFSNKAQHAILKYSPSELVGKKIWDLCVNEPDKKMLQAYFSRLVNEQPEPTPYFGKNMTRDGMLVDVRVDWTYKQDAQGRLVGFVSVITDVTAYKQAEELRSRLIAVMEATSDFVAMEQTDGKVLYFNKAARIMLGIGEDEDISGIRIPDTHPEWAGKKVIAEGIPAAIRDGVWSGETAFLRRDGVEISVSQVIIAHKDADGTVKYLSTIARSITEQKRINEEMYLLQELTRTVSVAESFHDALVVAIQKICDFTGWVYGEAWMPHTDGTSLKCSHTYYCGFEGLEKFGVLSEGFVFPAGVGLPGRAWAEKQPVWVRDVTCDPHYLRAPLAREAGLKTGIAFPVIADNEAVTIIVFYHVKTEEKDERLVKLVSTALSQIGSIVKRKQAEDELRLYGTLFSEISDLAYILDTKGNILFVNRVFEELTGYKTGQFIGKPIAPLFDEENYKIAMEAYTRTLKGEKQQCELRFKNTRVLCEHKCLPLKDNNNRITGVIGTARDVTEHRQKDEVERKLREQLYHVQKLDSVGTLAGGIAHDFNNILTAIIGFGNLLHKKMRDGSSSKGFVERILKSAERAADLTQGLLAFSRKQTHNPVPVNVNEILRDVEGLLARVMREDIILRTTLTDKKCVVLADIGQMEQVLMNLAINARDAMPNGGVLEISSDIAKIDDTFIKTHGYGLLGTHAVVAVSDTGTGMDKDTRDRIFEPFFTTKELGKGTGLGLAMVYGIIKQHNGYINVESEPGKGATFRIYLPVVEKKAESAKEEVSVLSQDGTEMILVAEDEGEVRGLLKIVLEEHGYTVITAEDGSNAIEKFKENKDTIQLLLMDVIMPNMNGKEAYEAIEAMRADIKVLFMSGYREDLAWKKDLLGKGFPLVAKPVSPDELLLKIRKALDK